MLIAGSLGAAPAFGWRHGFLFPQYNGGLMALDPAGNTVAMNYEDGDVVKLAASDGSETWRVTLAAALYSLAIDSAGDVVVAGHSATFPWDFTVIKLSGSDGSQLWRRDFDGTQTVPSDNESANDVVVDGAGDVIATGYLTNDPTNADILVIKLAGATGAELWRHEEDETNGNQSAYRVLADASGDVIVTTSNNGLIKFDGTLGTELWRTSVFFDTLTVDPSGDVVGAHYFAVEKIDGGTGAQVWLTNLTFDIADVAIDAAGDVVAVGSGPYTVGDNVWGVFKLNGNSGAELWRNTEVKGRMPAYGDSAFAVAVDGAGDAIVGGYISNPPADIWYWLAVAKFSGSSGTELWRQLVEEQESVATSVAVDASGTPVVGGRTAFYFTVMALNPLDGAIGPVTGYQLVVKDNAGNANSRSIFAQSKDKSLNPPVPGTVRDPSIAGGELELVNPTTLESAVFTLPAASWITLGTAAKPKGYRYLDPSGVNGPCRLVLLKRGTLRVLCQGYLGPIPFSLDEPTQGSLTLSLRLGSGEGQCVTFGGTVVADAGTSNPGPGGIFKAKESPAASGRCP